ncbi:3-oxoacyl-ACP reductase [Virgisporangium ochraceum]|uniref:3-oxoacyl-ACP reductase n=1 Tax=Virgisporangium ochraceum TaxID=65505 RepID=A0A8J3ZRL8_9ACTN|nr:3-oxoacyl-ACP reductase [Virgisporangium ochraceum]
MSGGGTGIGRAIAVAFARAGEDVTIVGRRADVLAKVAAEFDTVTAVAADLSVPADVERVAATLDSVDVVVNNAGGAVYDGPLSTLEDQAAQWRAELDANVLTAALLTTALMPKLTRPGGRIVFMSSVAAVKGGGVYGAAKAALHGWAYALATRLGPDGITVNVVAPGYVADTEFFGERMSPEFHESRVRQTLVGRGGVPDDIAAAVTYLAAPDAGYITGQVIHVNGGSALGR